MRRSFLEGSTQTSASGSEVQAPEPMPSTGAERLIALAVFLESLPPQSFDFAEWVTQFDADAKCGTVCCALGWCPSVFEDWEWQEGGELGERLWYPAVAKTETALGSAQRFFDIRPSEARALFISNAQPSDWPIELRDNASAYLVAANIREFVNRKWPALAGSTADAPARSNSEQKGGN